MATLQEVDEKKSARCSFEFPLCCDSVEWCHYEELSSLIGVGHYELTNNQKKVGGITLLQYQSKQSFTRLSFKQSAPILDLKWHSISSNIYLSAATSIGCIQLYSLNDSLELQLKHNVKIPNIDKTDDKLPICLSLDWNQKNNCCCTSLSDGSVSILQFNEKNDNEIIHRIQGHSDQVWTACFDADNDKIVYSGADDCLFGVWDYQNKILINGDKDNHKMGICSIHNYNNYLLTGSYDEYLRIWDKRNWKKPIDSLKFNDGVWRIKANKNKILIATMRDHFNVVIFDETTQRLKNIYSYTGHYDKYNSDISNKDENKKEDIDILCYGCDWSHNDDDFIASCSFYDKQVHFWQHKI